jgi:predicted permease
MMTAPSRLSSGAALVEIVDSSANVTVPAVLVLLGLKVNKCRDGVLSMQAGVPSVMAVLVALRC